MIKEEKSTNKLQSPKVYASSGTNQKNKEYATALEPLFETSPAKRSNTSGHDVIIVGAGPAALTSAIYTTREDLETVLFEKGVIGGMAALTDCVDNYPGFPEGVSGMEFADNLRRQAERFGAKIELGEVTDIKREKTGIKVTTTDSKYHTRTVLVATGSQYSKLKIPGEKTYYAKGVHYCATCDGALYRDKKLVVVGGGNSAVQEALFLARYASHIDMLVRSKLRASDVLRQKLEQEPKIKIHIGVTTDKIAGDDQKVQKVIGTDTKTNKKVEFQIDGVFVFVGLKPNTEFLQNTNIELDEHGFVKTDSSLRTSVNGIFAAGDVRSGATMQIATAVGEGATAAFKIREYLESNHQ